MRLFVVGFIFLMSALGISGTGRGAPADPLPERVEFPSMDGHTMLVGYLFRPDDGVAGKHPAIVMMHGRAGAYSTAAQGIFDASTLSKRHVFWGRLWARQGYVALLVDGFGPRNYPEGFPIHSYGARPNAVNEVSVRPFDAYGALRYLASRSDVDADRIGLQGWSNGGSATIATLSSAWDEDSALANLKFKAAVAFYPGCALHDRFQENYRPYAPLRVFSGDADEEVSARTCKRLLDHAAGGDLAIEIYPGATHDFDDPGRKRRTNPANVEAANSAIEKTLLFFEDAFRSTPTERPAGATAHPGPSKAP